jgi:3-oxoacyl-[acyl-carrier protein] reductase
MSEKTVLVSGGSRGLGLAIVEDCLVHGWRVVTFSRSGSPRMAELTAEYAERFLHLQADQADLDAANSIVHAARQRFGHVDALVNNAAVAIDGVLALTPADRIRQVIDINVTAVSLLTRACVREFLRIPRSVPKSVINVSSIVALTGFRGLSIYSATKSALLGLTRSLARELGPANVTVNAVLPGYLTTQMSSALEQDQRTQIIRRTPLGRIGDPRDVTPVLRFLLGDEGRFITGQCIVVDGGATC